MPILMILTFLVLFAIALMSVVLGMRVVESGRKKQVAGVMENTGSAYAAPPPAILEAPPSQLGALDQYVRQLAFAGPLEKLLQQSGLTWTAGSFVFYSLIAALAGCAIGYKVHIALTPVPSMMAMALLMGALPYVYVRRTRTKRLQKIEEQFPACLDFLARSMRAGHAFSVSLEMLSEETPEPLCVELRHLFNEQNLGAHMDVALANFAERVPLLDVAYFTAAVTMQRESGGNLSEILTKLAYVIRERFRLKRQIRAASAHGRVTGAVLTLMPLVVILLMMVVVPEYLPVLTKDPLGRAMIVMALVDQFLGYYIIHKIVNFKV